MAQWYQIARCATATTIAAFAPAMTSVAEELAYPEGVVAVGYDGCCPCPTPAICPPDPCDAGGIVQPSISSPTPAEGVAEVTKMPADTSVPAPSSTPTAAPLDFGPISRPGGGVGFASASTVAAAPAPGYIDYAPVTNRFRVRYDNAQNSNEPTRGEFLYPTGAGFVNTNGPTGVGGGGAPFQEDIGIEELSFYFERALHENLSVFVDVPIRWVDGFDIDGNGSDDTLNGFGDLRLGAKLALIADCDTHVTGQFLVSTPTGNAREALGTGNTSFDIGLLWDQRLSSSTFLFGEVRDWFTLDAPTTTDGADTIDLNANILRVGVGVGVDLIDRSTCCKTKKLTGLVEAVGWTVLDGTSTSLTGGQQARDADGDTIINGKYGVRYTNGDQTAYVGYGHNWTDDRWYSDLVRFEWGYNF